MKKSTVEMKSICNKIYNSVWNNNRKFRNGKMNHTSYKSSMEAYKKVLKEMRKKGETNTQKRYCTDVIKFIEGSMRLYLEGENKC